MGQKTFLSQMYGEMTKAMGKPSMRKVTRAFSGTHAKVFRLTKSRASNPNWPMLVLTVTGRKTGKARDVPLVYVEDKGRFAVAAAYGGSDANPAWWINLQANPKATAFVNNTTVSVEAAVANPDERAKLWPLLVEMYPYFAEYQQRTSREIPVVLLTPTH